MSGDSFIKIYINHIKNICKGKIVPSGVRNSAQGEQILV